VAIEIRTGDPEVARVAACVNDPGAAAAVDAERALVVALGGGCQTPIGALASPVGDDLEIVAAVVSLDGSRAVHAHGRGPARAAAALGSRVGHQLIADGAGEILAEARSVQGQVEGIQP
jgi:hydroxymethylbilane synthase